MNRLILLGVWLVCNIASIYASLRMLYCIFKNPHKAWVMAIAHDQLANAATNGNPDRTISDRAYAASLKNDKWACKLCKLLNYMDPEHCKKAEGY